MWNRLVRLILINKYGPIVPQFKFASSRNQHDFQWKTKEIVLIWAKVSADMFLVDTIDLVEALNKEKNKNRNVFVSIKALTFITDKSNKRKSLYIWTFIGWKVTWVRLQLFRPLAWSQLVAHKHINDYLNCYRVHI